VTLSREILILRTTGYTQWEKFSEQLSRVRETLESIYRPAYYVRVGLRYVDIVRRSILGLNNVPWEDLLNPAIGGELSAPEFGESVDSAQRKLHCKLEGENRFLTLNTGIALADPTDPGGVKERCFLIDADFHTHQRTENQNVTAALDSFNQASGNLFRWAIRPRLREALEPQPLV
jgi:uncharacterized protein (TIGR04255 family)